MKGLSGSTCFQASRVNDVRAELGESPLWDPRTGLRWLDVNGRRLYALRHAGDVRSVELTTTVTCIELSTGPDLLAVTSGGFAWLDPQTGHVDEFLSLVDGRKATMNDGGVDPRGRCWAGSAVRDGSRRGALFRLDRGRPTIMVSDIGLSNGIGWSPEGDVLYHVDSAAGTLTAHRYDAAVGELGGSELVLNVPAEIGLPDGLMVDEDGAVWLAIWGRGEVWRLDPRSLTVSGRVRIPTPYVTSCILGGRDRSTLYVTTAADDNASGGGLLYAAEVPARGLPPRRYQRGAS